MNQVQIQNKLHILFLRKARKCVDTLELCALDRSRLAELKQEASGLEIVTAILLGMEKRLDEG